MPISLSVTAKLIPSLTTKLSVVMGSNVARFSQRVSAMHFFSDVGRQFILTNYLKVARRHLIS
jgi:hypothetical protein